MVLQSMCRAAACMGHGLASDRMQLKLGDDITAAECCEFHVCSVDQMSTREHLDRFKNSNPLHLPQELKELSCIHMKPVTMIRALGLTMPLQRVLPRGAATAYTFGRPLLGVGDQIYLVAFTYFSRRSLAISKVER